MKELGIRNMSAYIRKMSLDGLCIHLDLKDIRNSPNRSAASGTT